MRRNVNRVLSGEWRSSDALRPQTLSQLTSSQRRTVGNIKDTAYEVGYEKRHIKDMSINGVHVRILHGNDLEFDERNDYRMSHKIRWQNNPNARDPTWSQLKYFLQNNTFFQLSMFGESTYKKAEFMCADFASALHNNAEASGIRCADIAAFHRSGAHAIVMFDTTDKGWIFVDPTAGMVFSKRNYFDQGRNYIPDFAMIGESMVTPSRLREALNDYFSKGYASIEVRW